MAGSAHLEPASRTPAAFYTHVSYPVGQPPPTQVGSLRLDVVSGYALAFSRVVAWAGVSAFVYRHMGADEFGLLAMLRGTIALLSYTSLGIGPAMVHALALARRAVPATPLSPADAKTPPAATPTDPASPPTLDYAAKATSSSSSEQTVFAAGVAVTIPLVVLGMVLAVACGVAAPMILDIPVGYRGLVRSVAILLGVGVSIRMVGEPLSAALQSRGHLAIDNFILAGAELSWLATVWLWQPKAIVGIAAVWMMLSLMTAIARYLAARVLARDLRERTSADPRTVRSLLRFGVVIVVAQVADFLYAPTDFIIISWLLTPLELAAYAPAVQIDAALLLAVAGIAAALFPRAARAHADGNLRQLRRLYVLGTFASLALLGLAAAAVLLLSELIFNLWLGSAPTATLEILPLVLVHTVIGGSSGVGRSVLLGMGRVKAYTISVLVAGGANVALSLLLAGPGGLGLRGIVLATVIVVVARCAIWMPWYLVKMTKLE